MATVYITMKLMPENPDVNLEHIEKLAREKIESHGIKVHSAEKVPIAFGLVSIQIIMMADEQKGSTDLLEFELSKIPGVESVQVIDVRRGIG
ncbi:elongation factor 1-beta [Candidatus Woesearchaeota archaeon CG07_land_8_20_14_0_80_44_23]|nr:MAG: elongation factor 1-beta [Candidatus Woesearchaeota archaeon CG07_land_8_20_14_0_80_44_23]